MRRLLSGLGVAALCLSGLALVSCHDENSADSNMRRQQEAMTSQANAQAGMPAITNFTEKKLLKLILELRDTPNLVTWTYTTDLNGKLHNACGPNTGPSIGYPIPYATQYSNPQRFAWTYNGGTNSPGQYQFGTLPQADPNGLFAPQSAEGSWILCVDSTEKNPARVNKPVYIEDRVRTFQYKVGSED